MIQYKKHRLYASGISFAIPDSFFFYTETDFVTEDNLSFLSPDKRYRLNFQLTSSLCGSTDEDLALMIRDTGGRELLAPTPIIINGLKGHYAVYGGGDELYYELRLQSRSDEYEDNQLILIIICSEEEDIWGIAESDTVKEIIQGIRPEDP